MGEMLFTMGDLYPAMSTFETGNLANPDADDQNALNENAALAEKTDVKHARPKFVWLAVGVIVAIVVMMGID